MEGKKGTPITGRVINHNHIGSRMKQRQSWTTGQNGNGCSFVVWSVDNTV